MSASGSSGCCPSRWWCLGVGYVTSSPVGERPTGAVSGPYPTQAYALGKCPPDSGSGSGSGGAPVEMTGCCPGKFLSAVTITFDGGHGTATLTSDGTNLVGEKTFACGGPIPLRYLPDSCVMEYSCDGVTWVPAGASVGSPVCDPFVDSREHLLELNSGANGCTFAVCGDIRVIEVAE